MQLLLVLSLFIFSLALGSPADILNIEKLDAEEAQLLDAKDFAGLANIFTTNATYNSGSGPNIIGIDAIEARLSSFFPAGTVSQNAVTTSSITVLAPNRKGAAVTATGVVYTTVTYIGTGKLAGQLFAAYAKYEDKYVKTEESSRYGGWKISERFFVLFGSPVGNPALLPASSKRI